MQAWPRLGCEMRRATRADLALCRVIECYLAGHGRDGVGFGRASGGLRIVAGGRAHLLLLRTAPAGRLEALPSGAILACGIGPGAAPAGRLGRDFGALRHSCAYPHPRGG